MFVTFLCYPRSPRQLLPSPLSSFGFELNTPQDPINLPVPPLYFTFVGRCPRIGSARSQLPRVHFPRVVPHVTAAGTPHAPRLPSGHAAVPVIPTGLGAGGHGIERGAAVALEETVLPVGPVKS